MIFDVEKLTATMLSAASAALTGRWPAIRPLAEVEFRRLAKSLEDVAELTQSGAIDQNRARQLMHIHQITARSVLCTIEGLGILTAEQAIRAAAAAIAGVVNRVVGFKLL